MHTAFIRSEQKYHLYASTSKNRKYIRTQAEMSYQKNKSQKSQYNSDLHKKTNE